MEILEQDDVLPDEGMEQVEIKESSSEESEDTSLLRQENIEKFLVDVGLQSPLDFVFLNYSMSSSRQKIQQITNNLLFLFHIVTSETLEQERPFPRCAFVEKISTEEENEKLNIVWTFSPSPQFIERSIQPFEAFHSYFMNVLKPNLHYSASELYEILKQRKGETYFLNHGARENSIDSMFHILFVSPKAIIAFQVPPVNLSLLNKKEMFSSRWISDSEAAIIQDCQEYEIFACPRMEEGDDSEKKIE